MFRELGTKLDNKIQDIKEWFYKGRFYRLYARCKVPHMVKRIETISHLEHFLKYCVKRGWMTDKSAEKHRKRLCMKVVLKMEYFRKIWYNIII